MREVVKPGLILFLITVITAACLGLVNSVTAEVIIKNELETKNKAMAMLLPEAKDNNFGNDVFVGEDGVDCYNIGYDATTPAGIVFTMLQKGYGGEMKILVALLPDGVVKGVQIVNHSETPGLGANANNEKFTNQYIGKSGVVSVVKGVPQDNEIQAITSATITSNYVTEAVNNALAYFDANFKGGLE